jgi:hypothetical protein
MVEYASESMVREISTLVITCLDGAQVFNLSCNFVAATPGVYHLRTFNAQSEKITVRGVLNNINRI